MKDYLSSSQTDNRNLVHSNRSMQNDDKMKNIYGMLERQEDVIASLLYKYRDSSSFVPDSHQRFINKRSRTIDNSYLPNNDNLMQKIATNNQHGSLTARETSGKSQISRFNSRQRDKSEPLSLPTLNSKISKPTRKKYQKQQNLVFFRQQKSRQREKLRQQLYKIYGEHNKNNLLKISYDTKKAPKKKIKKLRSMSIPPKSALSSIQSAEKSMHNQLQQLQPLKQAQQHTDLQSDDSSEGQQVQSMYYERQFRDTLRGQCLEEINFLYFSKNEAMKQWTERLLSLFQNHDKQITALRVKSKYLHSFDQKFWTVGIFNTDNI